MLVRGCIVVVVGFGLGMAIITGIDRATFFFFFFFFFFVLQWHRPKTCTC